MHLDDSIGCITCLYVYGSFRIIFIYCVHIPYDVHAYLYPTLNSNPLLSTIHSCQKMYDLFKKTKEDDPPIKVNITVEVMKNIAKTIPTNDQIVFMHAMCCLLLYAKPWQIDLPTSPLKILLQVGVDANAIPENGVYNCLTLLAAQHSEKGSFKQNQVTIARNLVEAGADVNRSSLRDGAGLIAPLYFACFSTHYTNLDFIQLLLENGANPNQQTVDGMTPLLASLEMAVGAAIFVLKFKHANKVEVDPNVRNNRGETLWSRLCTSLDNNMRQRETVRETGQAAVYSDKGWNTTEQYDTHIARLNEMKSLVEACGADMTGFPMLNAPLCKIVPWQEHMLRSKLKNGRQRQINTSSNPWIECEVSDLFEVDILRDKKAPSWSKDEGGKSVFYIMDSKAKMFEAHEGREYLHSAGGGSQRLEWGS